jgi:hypothetical protein
MTLNPRKKKTKNLELSGTQKDFDVLSDVLEQAAERLNIDIYPADYDIPGRILLKRSGEATQWQYPKLSEALKAFANGLREGGDGTVAFESPQITDDPEKFVKDSPTLRLMNQTSVGKRLGVGQYIQEDIIGDFTAMLDPKTKGARMQPLSNMQPLWVYAKNITLEGETPMGVVARDLNEIAKIKNYPADLNQATGLWKKAKKEGYNQAYFVVMRADKDYPMQMPLQSIPGAWNDWIKGRPVPKMMSVFGNKPPRNMGDYLERFAVYTTARTFGLKDAFLAPVFVGTPWDGRKVGSKKHFEDKILQTSPIKSRGAEGSEYSTYYGFVVVGKGPRRTPSLGKEKTDSALDLPGFET